MTPYLPPSLTVIQVSILKIRAEKLDIDENCPRGLYLRSVARGCIQENDSDTDKGVFQQAVLYHCAAVARRGVTDGLHMTYPLPQAPVVHIYDEVAGVGLWAMSEIKTDRAYGHSLAACNLRFVHPKQLHVTALIGFSPKEDRKRHDIYWMTHCVGLSMEHEIEEIFSAIANPWHTSERLL